MAEVVARYLVRSIGTGGALAGLIGNVSADTGVIDSQMAVESSETEDHVRSLLPAGIK